MYPDLVAEFEKLSKKYLYALSKKIKKIESKRQPYMCEYDEPKKIPIIRQGRWPKDKILEFNDHKYCNTETVPKVDWNDSRLEKKWTSMYDFLFIPTELSGMYLYRYHLYKNIIEQRNQELQDRYQDLTNTQQRQLSYFNPIISALATASCLLYSIPNLNEPQIQYRLFCAIYSRVIACLSPYRGKEDLAFIINDLESDVTLIKLKHSNKLSHRGFIPDNRISLLIIIFGGLLFIQSDDYIYKLPGLALITLCIYWMLILPMQNNISAFSNKLDLLADSVLLELQKISSDINIAMDEIVEKSLLELNVANNRFSLFANRATDMLSQVHTDINQQTTNLVKNLKINVTGIKLLSM